MKRTFLILATILITIVAIGQLPPVYKSGNVGFVSFIPNRIDANDPSSDLDTIQFKQNYSAIADADSLIAFIKINGENKIVGKTKWDMKPANLTFYLKETNPAAPSLSTGSSYNDTIFIAALLYGNLFELKLHELQMMGNDKTIILSQPMALYTVKSVSLGEPLKNLFSIDYFAWLYSQCPVPGIDRLVLENTPLTRSDINIRELLPKFCKGYSFLIERGEGEVFLKDKVFHYKMEKADLDRGYINIIIIAEGYSGCPGTRLFSHQIMFPPPAATKFDELNIREFRKLVENLKSEIVDGNLVLSTKKPFPEINLRLSIHYTGRGPKIVDHGNYGGDDGFTATIPLTNEWNDGDPKASWMLYVYQVNSNNRFFIRSKSFNN